MAFAGETLRVRSKITDYDGKAITDADGVTVTLDVWKPDKTKLFGPVTMAWESVHKYWFYDWATVTADATPVALAAGTYRSRVTAVGGGKDAWQFGRIKLSPNPVS
jgi:hypothetical protein